MSIKVNLDIDFKLLKAQKRALLDLIWNKEDHPAWGIIDLIDDIQDQAVDNNGVNEVEVFGKLR